MRVQSQNLIKFNFDEPIGKPVLQESRFSYVLWSLLKSLASTSYQQNFGKLFLEMTLFKVNLNLTVTSLQYRSP